MKRLRHTPEWIKKGLIVLASALVIFGVVYVVAGKLLFLERGIVDTFFLFRKPKLMNDINPYVCTRSRLMAFDETAIGTIGPWVWKRYVHARFLDRLEQFSPQTVMFDVMFIDREAVPGFVADRLAPEPGVMEKVQAVYGGMDRELAESLARYDNVYTDVMLMEQTRDELPDEYKERIRLTESCLSKIALPAVMTEEQKKLFHSLEPILPEYVRHVTPAVINASRDVDGVIRSWPLYYTYAPRDGKPSEVLTIVPSLLLKFFHTDIRDVTIAPGKFVFRKARVPRLDSTRQAAVVPAKTGDVLGRLVNAAVPAGYRYNANLFRFMVHQYSRETAPSKRIPYFPLHVLQRADGQWEILDSWEVLDAAKALGSAEIKLAMYDENVVEIPTPTVGRNGIYINFADRQSMVMNDPETRRTRLYTPIPTESYAAVYFMDTLPDLPAPNAEGDSEIGAADREKLEAWFLSYCEQRARAVYDQACEELKAGVEDMTALRAYVNRYPDERRFLLYQDFLSRTNAEPGKLSALWADYRAYAAAAGQSEDWLLNDRQILDCLAEEYRVHFDKYYNKFIFAGGTALGIGDLQQTPYSAMAGINVIINAFNTVATDNLLTFTRDIPRLDVMVLLVFCLATALLYSSLNVRVSGWVMLLVLVGTYGVGLQLFKHGNLVLTTLPLLMANLATFLTALVYKLVTEEHDKRFLQKTFGAYLAPELIERMYRDKKMPELGGEARTLTAFFTDIKGFSTFSEILTAHQLVELLNEYLSSMTEILIEEGGTLDKYIGDAIVSFFGAPAELPDNGYRACRAAVRMQERLAELRAKWEGERKQPDEPDRNTRKLPPDQWAPEHKWPALVHDMRMRVGINSGEVVVGNMGSTMRMNYTMMGDPVNLAARLESAAKQYGVYTLVSQSTLDQAVTGPDGKPARVGDLVEARFLDNVTVIGKSEPVKIYELCALRGGLSEQDARLFEVFALAMEHYRQMRWDAALEMFRQAALMERTPGAKVTPSAVFIERCLEFRGNPPAARPEDWDGVYRLTTK